MTLAAECVKCGREVSFRRPVGELPMVKAGSRRALRDEVCMACGGSLVVNEERTRQQLRWRLRGAGGRGRR